jgi:hypothetical protein
MLAFELVPDDITRAWADRDPPDAHTLVPLAAPRLATAIRINELDDAYQCRSSMSLSSLLVCRAKRVHVGRCGVKRRDATGEELVLALANLLEGHRLCLGDDANLVATGEEPMYTCECGSPLPPLATFTF